MSRCVLTCVALLVASLLAPFPARAQPPVQDELNRAKAALQLKKFDEAARRFGALAERGNAEAQFSMGRFTAMGTGVPKNLEQSTQWYRRAADQGHTEAQAVLGLHYMQGLGVAPNYAEAARWSKLAADKGHGGAAYNLAKMYVTGGPGLTADRTAAEQWSKTAMAKGFPDPLKVRPDKPKRSDEAVALFKQGQDLFRAGDMAGAARLFARCAQMGDAPCQLQIGWHHEEGKGVPRNLQEAMRWYRAAADQHDPRAAENLGLMYERGKGVAKNCKTAVEWYARGALWNDHNSLYSLGRMYQFGFGVKEDRAKAHAYFRQSGALGNLKAREALATFDRFVFPDPQSAAIYDERVQRWQRAIDGCQAQANSTGQPVTCLVPAIDWNPKTWQDC
jgi:uncharacterized protein